jgi:hypothetical protein
LRTFDDAIKFSEGQNLILNWGVSHSRNPVAWEMIYNNTRNIFGNPYDTEELIDKEKFYKGNVYIVPPTININGFVPATNKTYVGRKDLKGSGGKGIIFFRKVIKEDGYVVEIYDYDKKSFETLPLVDFCHAISFVKQVTEYVKKTHEYRFFCNAEGIVHVVEKRKGKTNNLENAAPELPMANYLRNHTNGWVFCQEGIAENNPNFNSVIEFANLKLVPRSHNLPIVAWDVGYNLDTDRTVVYEGNTSPGLTSPITSEKVISSLGRLIEAQMEATKKPSFSLEALMSQAATISATMEEPMPDPDDDEDEDEDPAIDPCDMPPAVSFTPPPIED